MSAYPLQVSLGAVDEVRGDAEPHVPLVPLHPGVREDAGQLPPLSHPGAIADHEPCRRCTVRDIDARCATTTRDTEGGVAGKTPTARQGE